MEVSDQIIKVLDNLCEKFGLAIDWTSDTILPYATTLFNKLVSFEIWSSVAYIVFAIIGLIVSIAGIKYSIKHMDDLEIFAVIVVVLTIFLGLFTISTIGSEIMDIVKCVTFPELFVFEYIQELLSSTS